MAKPLITLEHFGEPEPKEDRTPLVSLSEDEAGPLISMENFERTTPVEPDLPELMEQVLPDTGIVADYVRAQIEPVPVGVGMEGVDLGPDQEAASPRIVASLGTSLAGEAVRQPMRRLPAADIGTGEPGEEALPPELTFAPPESLRLPGGVEHEKIAREVGSLAAGIVTEFAAAEPMLNLSMKFVGKMREFVRASRAGGPKAALAEPPMPDEIDDAVRVAMEAKREARKVTKPGDVQVSAETKQALAEATAAVEGELLPPDIQGAINDLPTPRSGWRRLWRWEGQGAEAAGAAKGKRGGGWFEESPGVYYSEGSRIEDLKYVDVPGDELARAKTDPTTTEVLLSNRWVKRAKPVPKRATIPGGELEPPLSAASDLEAMQQAGLKPQAIRRINKFTETLMKEAGLQLDPKRSAYSQVMETLASDIIPPNKAAEILRVHAEEFRTLTAMFGETVHEASKTMLEMKYFHDAMSRIYPGWKAETRKVSGLVSRMKTPDPVRLVEGSKATVASTIRTFLTSGISVMTRNAGATLWRIGPMEFLNNAYGIGLQYTVAPVVRGTAKMFGKTITKQKGNLSIYDVAGELYNVFTKAGRSRSKQITDFFGRNFPQVANKVSARHMGDMGVILTKAEAAGLKLTKAERAQLQLGRAVGTLRVFNQLQERIFRGPNAAAQLIREWRRLGIQPQVGLKHLMDAERVALSTAKKGSRAYQRILGQELVGRQVMSPEMMDGALKHMLDLSFSSEWNKGHIAEQYIGMWEKVLKIPGVNVLALSTSETASAGTFARFVMSTMRYLNEYHNPVRWAKMFGPKGMAEIARGNGAMAAKAMTGMTMTYLGWEIVNNRVPGIKRGAKPLELNVGGRDIDMSPYLPIVVPLYTADIIKRFQDGEMNRLYLRDLERGILGLRGGPIGVWSIDQFLGQLGAAFGKAAGEFSDEDKSWIEAMSGTSAELASDPKFQQLGQDLLGTWIDLGLPAFFTSLSDIYKEYDEDAKLRRDVRHDVWGRARQKLQFLQPVGLVDKNPVLEVPTRAGPVKEPFPAFKQYFGIRIVDPRNKLEFELDKHGFTAQEIQTKTGLHEFDQTIAKHLGETVEYSVLPLLEGGWYDDWSPSFQSYMLKMYMDYANQSAVEMATSEWIALGRHEEIERLKFEKRSMRERRFQEGLGIGPSGLGVFQ